MARVALYTRVSTEEQAVHGYSLDAQRTALEEWAAANHHSIAGVYSDEGISARKPAAKRPALQRLLQAVEQGRVDLIAFTKLDRWFRNVAEYYKVQPILEKAGTSWTAIQEDYSTDSASSRLKVNIMLSVAQDESDRTGERLKAIYKARIASGQPIINKASTGYILSDGKLKKDPATRAGVEAFFNSLSLTGSLIAAVRSAQAAGLPLRVDTARYMRDNPIYYGQYNGVDGMAEPYISLEEFASINRPKGRPRATKPGRVYLFSGLVFCPKCGTRFGGHAPYYDSQSQGRVYTQKYESKCRNKEAFGVCENRTLIREAVLEEYLLNAVSPAFKALRAQVASWGVQDDGAAIEASIKAEKVKEKRLRELYLSGLYTLDELKVEKEEIAKSITALEAKKAQISTPPNLGGLEALLAEDWERKYKTLPKTDQAAFWRKLLKKITVSPEREIDFIFNF